MLILKKLAVYDLHSIALLILFISFSSFKVLSQANPQQTINLLNNKLCKNHQWKAEKLPALRASTSCFSRASWAESSLVWDLPQFPGSHRAPVLSLLDIQSSDKCEKFVCWDRENYSGNVGICSPYLRIYALSISDHWLLQNWQENTANFKDLSSSIKPFPFHVIKLKCN